MATDLTISNIVGKVFPDPDERKSVAVECIRQIEQDILDRGAWEAKRLEWLKLHMCEPPDRVLPFDGAANICHTISAASNLQFQGRAYASLFEQPYPERVKVMPVEAGDAGKAKDVGHFLNWQLIVEMVEYEAEWDRMLMELPIFGTTFTKVWWCMDEQRPKIMYIPAVDVIVPNNTASLKTALRVTHRMRVHIENIKRSGREGLYEYTEDLRQGEDPADTSDITQKGEEAQGTDASSSDENALNCLYECHRDMILEDGADPEPVTLTIDKANAEILRLVKRTHEVAGKKYVIEQFNDYHMIPNPEGFYSFGYAHFLEGPNKILNSLINQYIDAGRLSNQPFVFAGRGSGLRKKKMPLHPGSRIDVNDVTQILPMKLPGVDSNMPILIKMMETAADAITTNSDELQGGSSVSRDPTVRGTLARIEQGLVSFGVIIKRLARQQNAEIRRIYTLDQLFLPSGKAYRVLGKTDADGFGTVKRDQLQGKFDFFSTADPAFASKQQQRGEAAQMLEMSLSVPGVAPSELGPGNPALLNEIMRDFFRTFGKPEIVMLLPETPEPPISPGMENQRIREGTEVQAKQGEPHAEHLAEHEEEMRENPSDMLAQHMQEHRQIFAQEIAAAQNAQIEQAAQATEQA